jgi:DNA-binding NtrC family response regulator
MLIVVAGVHEAAVRSVSTALETQSWLVRAHTLAGAEAWARAVEPIAGYCAIYDDDEPAWLSALDQARRKEQPLIVVSPAPPKRARPNVWIDRLPSSRTLSNLFIERVGRAPSAGPRRGRKSDLIVGSSRAIVDLRQRLERMAATSIPVIITGESGSGKELVARALHFCGPRADRPFIPVNCAAIPEALFEAELFGHEKGAFTGAVRTRAGLFEAGDGGTLFLDEIGELPRAMQPKLLRLLETGEVTRLGGNEVRHVTVRVVAATNRNLVDEVRAGRFRDDLYYRLGGYPIRIPPLRERAEDLPELVAHQLAEMCSRDGVPPAPITQAALFKLLEHDWPGNVRELINVLQCALLTAGGGPIDAEHVSVPSTSTPMVTPYREAKQEFEAQYYSQLLRLCGGNITMTAKLAHKTRKEIYDTLRKLCMHADEFRETDPGATNDADAAIRVGGQRPSNHPLRQ